MVLPPFALARNAWRSKARLRARFMAEFLIRQEPDKTGRNMSVKIRRPNALPLPIRTVGFYAQFLPKSRAIGVPHACKPPSHRPNRDLPRTNGTGAGFFLAPLRG